MESILILISGGPYSGRAVDALKLAASMCEQGHRVSVFLIQDGVLCALGEGDTEAHRVFQGLASGGVASFCMGEDLTMRGYGANELSAGVEVSDYGHLVGLTTELDHRVIGVL